MQTKKYLQKSTFNRKLVWTSEKSLLKFEQRRKSNKIIICDKFIVLELFVLQIKYWLYQNMKLLNQFNLNIDFF